MFYDKSYYEKVDLGLLSSYYQAVYYDVHEAERFYLDEFKEAHPLEFGFFTAIARKRKRVCSLVETLKGLGLPLYFGTLTYNNEKDKNLIEWKRKEAFYFLNSVFEYFFLLEELGEEKERYHIHFVGVYRIGKNFDDFTSGWHSRQNIKPVETIDGVCRYLVKYATKQLPRIRTNRSMSRLEKVDNKCRKARKSWCYNGLDNLHEKERIKVLHLSLFDLI